MIIDYIFPDKHSKTNLINLIVRMLPLGWFNNASILLINNAEKECYEEEFQPYRKTDYKPMIIIVI